VRPWRFDGYAPALRRPTTFRSVALGAELLRPPRYEAYCGLFPLQRVDSPFPQHNAYAQGRKLGPASEEKACMLSPPLSSRSGNFQRLCSGGLRTGCESRSRRTGMPATGFRFRCAARGCSPRERDSERHRHAACQARPTSCCRPPSRAYGRSGSAAYTGLLQPWLDSAGECCGSQTGGAETWV
jgi:hypothetical protein